MRIATLTCLTLMAMASHVVAAPVFRITEVFAGLSGPDGTPDWIEVTNFGDMDGDTGTLWYDDESADISAGTELTSFNLSPGESAVFIVTDDATATSPAEFRALWGPVGNVGVGLGGGGLSQNGDAANILLGDGTIVDTLAYGAAGQTATIEDPAGIDQPATSLLGVNGAYESGSFANDTLNPFDPFLISLVGSPGRIPEPAGLLLLVAGMAVSIARRRG